MASYSMVNASIDDSEAISSLLQAAKRGGLAPFQRIKLGYVQGDMSLGLVRRRFERGAARSLPSMTQPEKLSE